MEIPILLCLNVLRGLLFLSVKEGSFASASSDLPHGNSTASYEPGPLDATESGRDEKLHIFTVDYEYVQIPYEVTLWILLASLAKIGEENIWHSFLISIQGQLIKMQRVQFS